jgi:hypothetical protein
VLARDWLRPDRVGGRRARQALLAATLAAGLLLAAAAFPLTDTWQDRVTAAIGLDVR